jgi:hypothetical protein
VTAQSVYRWTHKVESASVKRKVEGLDLNSGIVFILILMGHATEKFEGTHTPQGTHTSSGKIDQEKERT